MDELNPNNTIENSKNNDEPVSVMPDLTPSSEDEVFSQELKPAKPWYKRWWLYVYMFIFLASLAVLIIYTEDTNKVFDTFSVDNISNSIVNDNFTSAPSTTDITKVDNKIVQERLRFVDAPSIGNADAPVVIAEFADFQCQYCQQAFPIIQKVITEYSDNIRFIHLDFPLDSLHPLAYQAAHAARCADEQSGFWQYYDSLFENQASLTTNSFMVLAAANGLDTDAFSSCMASGKYTSAIIEQLKLGQELGVTGTPTFFINGHILSGVIPFDIWQQIIDLFLYGFTK